MPSFKPGDLLCLPLCLVICTSWLVHMGIICWRVFQDLVQSLWRVSCFNKDSLMQKQHAGYVKKKLSLLYINVRNWESLKNFLNHIHLICCTKKPKRINICIWACAKDLAFIREAPLIPFHPYQPKDACWIVNRTFLCLQFFIWPA